MPDSKDDNARGANAGAGETNVVDLDGQRLNRTPESGIVALWKLLGKALRDKRLSKADGAVVHAITGRMNDAGKAWPSIRRIAEDAGIDQRTATRAIKRLCELGYLDRVSGDRTTSNVYRVGTGEIVPTGDAAPTGKTVRKVRATLSKGTGNQVPDVRAGLPTELVHELVQGISPKNLSTGKRFEEFYSVYPKKEARPAAEKAWKRHKLDSVADAVIADVRARIADPGQWNDRKYIPQPAKFLNDKRWMDEWVPTGKVVAGQIDRDARTEADIEEANRQQLARFGIGGDQ